MSSKYSIGVMNQLADELEKAGFTAEHITKLKQFSNLSGILHVIDGKAKITWNEMKDLKIWKTIKIGTGKTVDDFCKSIKNISDWARGLMKSPEFTISTKERELDLCMMTTKEILGREGTYSEICEGVLKIGGEFCPAEAGPQLRDQYMDQPKGECLRIIMKPIKDSDGDLGIFSLRRDDGGPWLSTSYDILDDVWDVDCLWVFIRPRGK